MRAGSSAGQEGRAVGIDFFIDNNPRYRVTGYVGDPNAENEWDGKRFDGELLDGRQIQRLTEDHHHHAIEIQIETVPLEPPLPAELENFDPNPHWAYSGFSRFRERIAKTIGVELEMMYGFGSEYSVRRQYLMQVLGIPNGDGKGPEHYGEEVYAKAVEWWNENHRTWDTVDSGLVPLLDHSDCEDDLSPEECARIAPALREALDKLEPLSLPKAEPGTAAMVDQRDRENGEALLAMIEFCAKWKRRLVFC